MIGRGLSMSLRTCAECAASSRAYPPVTARIKSVMFVARFGTVLSCCIQAATVSGMSIRLPRQLAGVFLESGEYLDAHEGIAAKIDALAKPQQKDRKPDPAMMSPLATPFSTGTKSIGTAFPDLQATTRSLPGGNDRVERLHRL